MPILRSLLEAMGRLARIRVDDEASLRQVLQGIDETAVALLGVGSASIWRIDDDGYMRAINRFDSTTGEHSDDKGEVAIGHLRPPESIMEHQVLALEDTAQPPELMRHSAEIMRSFGVTACLVARIWVDGSVKGFLSLAHYDGVHHWTDGEIAAGEALAALIGKSLEAAARHQALRDLRQQQDRMSAFAEVSSDCFWETDPDHKISFLSPGAERAFGQPLDGLMDLTLVRALGGLDDVDGQWAELATLMAGQSALHDIDLRYSTGDAEERILRLNGKPVLNGDGAFLGYRGTAKDMTASFAGERRLRDHLAGIEHLSTTDESGRIILNKVFRETVKLAAQSIDGICPSLWLWDSRRRMLHCAAFFDHVEHRYIDAGLVQFDRFNPFVPRSFLQGVTVQVIDDVAQHPGLPPALVSLLHGYGTHALLIALLWRDGGLVGTLGIGSAQVGRRWSVTEKLIVESLANHVLRCLEAHELQVTRDALRHSEARFRGFAEATSDWFWETGRDHRFTYVSDHHRLATGLAVADVIGRTRWNICDHSKDDPTWRQHLAILARRLPFRDFRYSIVPPDGRRRYFSVSGKPVFSDQGEFLGYRGSGRERTEEHEANLRSEESASIYKAALEHSPHAVQLLDASDRVIFCNGPYRKGVDDRYGINTIGLTFEELLNTLVDVGHIPEADGREEEWIRERMDRHRAPHGVLRVDRGVNSDYAIEVHERKLEGGQTLLTFINATEYKDQLENLRLREARYRDFTAAACDWIWETDTEHRFTFIADVNDHKMALRGVEIIGRSRWEIEGFEAEEFEWRRHRGDLGAHRPFRDFRYRQTSTDGDAVTVSINGIPRFDENGAFIGYRGTGMKLPPDAEPPQSNLDLIAVLTGTLDQLPAGLAIVAADHSLEYCNPRLMHFCRELFDVEPQGLDYGEIVDHIVDRVLDEDRFGIKRAQVAERLRLQHENRCGYTTLFFGQGAIRCVDLIEFPAPGARSLICFNDSTVEMELAREAERVVRSRILSGPLAVLSTLLSQALEKLASGGQVEDEAVDAMRIAAGRLSLVERMQRPNPREFDLSAWFADFSKRPLAATSSGLRLELLNDAGPLQCHCDPELLAVALTEVLDNAADACDPDATVTIRLLGGGATAAEQQVRICIMDSGPGFPEGLVDRVLEPFVGTASGGVLRGLGLFIVERFAIAAGGYLTVRNRTNGGATVELGLPVNRRGASHPAAIAD